ncbi:hypothetical protein BH11MYX2_BH11MYX2_13550 [soil metagenome]
MVALLYLFGGSVVLLGLVLIVRALGTSKVAPREDEIPPARIATNGQSPFKSNEPRRLKRTMIPRIFAGLVLTGIGGAVIAFIYGVTHLDLGGSKGRILRLNGKAALPTSVKGTAWSDGSPATRACTPSWGGRCSIGVSTSRAFAALSHRASPSSTSSSRPGSPS